MSFFAFALLICLGRDKRDWANAAGPAFGRRQGKPVQLIADSEIGPDWAPVNFVHRHDDGGDPIIVLCKIDWAAYNRDPIQAPMYGKIVAHNGCMRQSAVQKPRLRVRASQLRRVHAALGDADAPLPPSGFVFHESRCGSTATTNMLGAVPGALVIAEAAPLHAVLATCEDMGSAAQMELLALLIAQWGRARGARRLFFKFDLLAFAVSGAVGEHSLPATMHKLFPAVPWIYLFRESVAVMASHVGGKMSRGYRMRGKLHGHTICQKRQRGRGAQVLATLARAGVRLPKKGSKVIRSRRKIGTVMDAWPGLELYCAGNLALISRLAMAAADAAAARKARGVRPTARYAFVDYRHLKPALLDFVLPVLFSTPLSALERSRLLEVASYHSKDSGGWGKESMLAKHSEHKKVAWKGDAEAKFKAAPPSMIAAAKLVLAPVYEQMVAREKATLPGWENMGEAP